MAIECCFNQCDEQDPSPRHHYVYTAYGFTQDATSAFLSGFHGQPMDWVIQGYPLEQGKRFYSPARGTFYSPAAPSPFAKGRANRYVYCGADPVNQKAPTRRHPKWVASFDNAINLFSAVHFITERVRKIRVN
ncbi:RHS repeat-associated core domain-containing protein [Pseudomonas sp. NY11955]|uniref:RHS repeat-associated core domain-containing protein n=1 Tax=Pseudomonas sp. NY11955 TaxID=3400363 RepID=UPI003A84E098